MKNCPKCNESISEEAKICPKCAHPMQKFGIFIHLLFSIILTLVVMIFIMKINGDSNLFIISMIVLALSSALVGKYRVNS